MPPSRVRIPPSPLPSTERCTSGLRSATGNRVRAERCVAGSNPALSALLSLARPRPQAREGDLVVDGLPDLDAGGRQHPVAELHPRCLVALRDLTALPERQAQRRSLPREEEQALEALGLAEPAVHLLRDYRRVLARPKDTLAACRRRSTSGTTRSSPRRSSMRMRTRTSSAAQGTRSRSGTTSP